jgi:peptidoglycan/xylan/chitin deacetylase (PgdA/CDA1 family)
MRYFVKSPFWFPLIYPSLVWKIPTQEKVIYLTFDDGPHPQITPWVIATLETYNAKATFFCVGKNVKQYPNIVQQIKQTGHSLGNHTMNHVNGWQTSTAHYLQEYNSTQAIMPTSYFRPPYGKITHSQIKAIKKHSNIVMWTKLCGDFDTQLTGKQCYNNLIQKPISPGDIILFHDSAKAWDRLQTALPSYLAHAQQQGFKFETIQLPSKLQI